MSDVVEPYRDGQDCPFCLSNISLALCLSIYGTTWMNAQVRCSRCGVHGPKATYQVDSNGTMLSELYKDQLSPDRRDYNPVATVAELRPKAIELWGKMPRLSVEKTS